MGIKNIIPNKCIIIIFIAVLSIIYLSNILIFSLGYNYLEFIFTEKIGWVEYLSLLIFLVSIYLGNKKITLFALLLIFNILALPASVDNLIPSILISSSNDYDLVYFPMITHTDIYLIFGLIRYWSSFKNKVTFEYTESFKIILVVLIFIMASILVNVFRKFNIYDTALILSHTFHLRYMILLLLLCFKTKVLDYKKEIFVGILISIVFLIVESISFSYIFGNNHRLISGSLKTNTFANILAGLFIYYTFLVIRDKISKFYILLILSLFGLIVATLTRSALFIVLMYLFLELLRYLFLLISKKQVIKFLIYKWLFVLLTVFVLFEINKNDRLGITNFKIEKIDVSKNQLNDILVLEQNDFTASLILRLNHFQTSINMIKDQSAWGIGPGKWNVYKTKYGSKNRQIMDSHNDILAFCSQYGIITGVLVCFSLYFIPFYIYKHKINLSLNKCEPLNYLFLISLVMAVAGITNAGLFKHQVFGFLSLILVLSINNHKEIFIK